MSVCVDISFVFWAFPGRRSGVIQETQVRAGPDKKVIYESIDHAAAFFLGFLE